MKSRLGEIVLEARNRKGLSQDQLAEVCGVSKQAISKVENQNKAGKNLLRALSETLELPMAFLFQEAQKFTPNSLHSEESELLSIFNAMPKPFQETARKQIYLLHSLALEMGNSETQKPKTKPLRLVGQVGAGGAIEHFADSDERDFDVPVELVKPTRYVLQVVGDSMIGVVNDGDYVVIEKCDVPVEGKVCVFRIGAGAVLKKWKQAKAGIELIPTNPNHQKKTVKENLACEGWLVEVVKGERT